MSGADQATYTGKGQDRASVDSNNISAVLNNYSFGGINGFGLAIIEIAQLYLLIENYNTAENYYDINVQDFNFFVNTYEGPMANSLAESMNRPLYESAFLYPQYGKYDILSNVGRGASIAARNLDKQWYATRRRVAKYQTGLGRWVDYKFAMGKLQETLSGFNLGFRYEDSRKDAYNEQRHAHRTNILNLGIGVGNAARAGLATSVAALSGARSQASSQLASIGNGLAQSNEYQGTKKGLQKISAQGLATQTQGTQSKVITGSDVQTPVGPQ